MEKTTYVDWAKRVALRIALFYAVMIISGIYMINISLYDMFHTPEILFAFFAIGCVIAFICDDFPKKLEDDNTKESTE